MEWLLTKTIPHASPPAEEPTKLASVVRNSDSTRLLIHHITYIRIQLNHNVLLPSPATMTSGSHSAPSHCHHLPTSSFSAHDKLPVSNSPPQAAHHHSQSQAQPAQRRQTYPQQNRNKPQPQPQRHIHPHPHHSILLLHICRIIIPNHNRNSPTIIWGSRFFLRLIQKIPSFLHWLRLLLIPNISRILLFQHRRSRRNGIHPNKYSTTYVDLSGCG